MRKSPSEFPNSSLNAHLNLNGSCTISIRFLRVFLKRIARVAVKRNIPPKKENELTFLSQIFAGALMQRAVRQLYFILFLFLFLLQASSIWSQTSPPQSVLGTEAITKANPTPSLREQSWGILEAGVKDSSSVNRASAVRVLSLLRGEPKAVPMAAKALDDLKPPVRTAAAIALGKLHAASSIPKLKKTLADKNTLVVLAASHSLLTLKDKSGYEAYYAILMGDRKGEGLIASQLATLKDPKQMAALGFHEGIGFVPFGDISYMAFRTMTKDQGAPLRAAS